MNLPFTVEQFLDVIVNYNLAVWPMQIILNGLAIIAIILSVKKNRISDKTISSILAFFWLWMGIAYHFAFFTSINNAAYLFGTLFVIQGIIFLFAGVYRNYLSFRAGSDSFSVIGLVFILYALVLYPVIGYIAGHAYPQQPTFGLPCPTTIFTFGILLLADKRVPKSSLIIPFIWSIIGTGAALKMSIVEDFGLFAAGILGILLILLKNSKLHAVDK